MRVLHVASEVAPFAQTGGLADVLAGLPAAQVAVGALPPVPPAPTTMAVPRRRGEPAVPEPAAPTEAAGVQAAVLVPLYRGVAARLAAAGVAIDDGVAIALQVGPHAFDARVRRANVGGVAYGFLECPGLYDRIGGLYGPTSTSEYADNAVRFAALGRAALTAGEWLLGGPVDVLHVHDWQGGAAAIYAHLERARVGAGPVVVATIHNLAFRGVFEKSMMTELGIPWDLFTRGGVEFYDQLSLLKGGLAVADAVTTVSPSYAREILTPERGEALDAFLRWDVSRLVGIANGIDEAAWDPRTDRAIAAGYSADDLAGKAVCRAALIAETGLAPVADDRPVIAAVSRMSDQKGLDLLAAIVPQLGALGVRLVVLGSGDPELEARWRYLASAFREHVAVRIGFDLAYSRRVYAGSDLFVMPSRFEPCGLGQMYAMRYGSIPVVSSVGGLRDTVTDIGHGTGAAAGGSAVATASADGGASSGGARRIGTGIRFDSVTAPALLAALERGVKLVTDRAAVARVRRAAMRRDSSWNTPAREYLALYESLLAPRRRGSGSTP